MMNKCHLIKLKETICLLFCAYKRNSEWVSFQITSAVNDQQHSKGTNIKEHSLSADPKDKRRCEQIAQPLSDNFDHGKMSTEEQAHRLS
jgi:hypothetical protein